MDEVDDGEGDSEAAAVPWDRYFDEARDVRLEHRGGVFRLPPVFATALLSCDVSLAQCESVCGAASASGVKQEVRKLSGTAACLHCLHSHL